LKKPYIKKNSEIEGFNVWIVDGNYIRNHIDVEFTNSGLNYRFPFIPKDELWIDEQFGDKDEVEYFAVGLLNYQRLRDEGILRRPAIVLADKMERSLRHKDLRKEYGSFSKATKEKISRRVHKKLLHDYSNKVKVWIVRGNLVRSLYFIDFTEGGHDWAYKFVPGNEVWIDDDIKPRERKYIILHEILERNLMSRGWRYNRAHAFVSRVESYYRKNPKKLNKRIVVEVNKMIPDYE